MTQSMQRNHTNSKNDRKPNRRNRMKSEPQKKRTQWNPNGLKPDLAQNRTEEKNSTNQSLPRKPDSQTKSNQNRTDEIGRNPNRKNQTERNPKY